MWRRLQKWSLCQLTTRRSPIAYLAILAYAVDCVLIIAELDRVDFSIMCLPAHGTLMLLHIWGENQYWTFPVLTQSWGEDRETFYVPEVSVTALQTSLGEPSPVPALGAYTPNFTLATKTIVYNYSTLQGCSCSLFTAGILHPSTTGTSPPLVILPIPAADSSVLPKTWDCSIHLCQKHIPHAKAGGLNCLYCKDRLKRTENRNCFQKEDWCEALAFKWKVSH